MDMNDDRLSAREHGEMKDRVLAGARRIRPVGAHRAQFAAAAVALVLVGGIAGGAIATTALSGRDQLPPATTPSPSSPEPTPSTTPTTVPAGGVLAFDGVCADILGDDEVSAALGLATRLIPERWHTGEYRALGGIDCFWASEEYNAAFVSVVAYPVDQVPATILAAAEAGGCPPPWVASGCAVAGVVDGTWVMVSAKREGGDASAATQALFDLAIDRVTQYPAPVAPQRTPEWWVLPTCATIAESLDAAALGLDRIEVSDWVESQRPSDADASSLTEVAGVASWCEFRGTRDDDVDAWQNVFVRYVAGGAWDWASVEADSVAPVDVAGAQSAYVVHDNGRLEGASDLLAVSDGTNVLTLQGHDVLMSGPEAFAPFAAAVLAAIQAAQ